MKQRMKESYEKGVAIHSAPSFALGTVRCAAKRKQGDRWAGYRASKMRNQDADVVKVAEGNMNRGGSASPWEVLRSRRPQTRLETSCTRTGRPRGRPPQRIVAGRREKALAVLLACTPSRSRTAEKYQ